jgi:hypothetical protein
MNFENIIRVKWKEKMISYINYKLQSNKLFKIAFGK